VRSERAPAALAGDAVLWHDVECAPYEADLGLWRELAADRGDPLLDIGCGTGRVALDLAALGHEVTGLDSDPDLVRALTARARARGVRVAAGVADIRSLALGGEPFRLAIAAMQVFQLLGGPAGRAGALTCVRHHLAPGGLLAIALADPFEGLTPDEALPPLPDLREEAGWVFSSIPTGVRAVGGERGDGIEVNRLRQAVSPTGELSEHLATVRLDGVDPARLEAAAAEVGYRPRPRRRIPETRDHVGSTVVMLEAE
jgi:SAM-dependent methyltransferase